MTLQKCTHCGLEGDPEIAAVPHKSTCRTAGKDSDYITVGSTKPIKVTAPDLGDKLDPEPIAVKAKPAKKPKKARRK